MHVSEVVVRGCIGGEHHDLGHALEKATVNAYQTDASSGLHAHDHTEIHLGRDAYLTLRCLATMFSAFL